MIGQTETVGGRRGTQASMLSVHQYSASGTMGNVHTATPTGRLEV